MSEPKPDKMKVYLDFETTGLGPAAQAFEVAWLPEGEDSTFARSLFLTHTLWGAEPAALQINRYRERGIAEREVATEDQLDQLRQEITGANLVIANPPFDIPHLMSVLGFQVWHHRITDIESYAQALFGLKNPPGMFDIYERLVAMGFDTPEPDHTAAGDVRTLAAADRALTEYGNRLRAAMKQVEFQETPISKREVAAW